MAQRNSAMDQMDALYRTEGRNMMTGYQPRARSGPSGAERLATAAGSLGQRLLGPEGDAQSSMAGSRGAYRASQMRPTGPTQGAPPAVDLSLMASGAGAYQAGRAVQGPQGYDGGQMVRPIDKQNPYAPPKPLTPDDRKLSGELDAAANDYMGKLRGGGSKLTPEQRKMSRDMDTQTDDFLARMGALYGNRGGA